MEREQVGTDVRSTGRKSFLAVTVEDQLHRVEDSHILTPAGISASIAMALRVVSCYYDDAVICNTAPYREYPFLFDNRRRI